MTLQSTPLLPPCATTTPLLSQNQRPRALQACPRYQHPTPHCWSSACLLAAIVPAFIQSNAFASQNTVASGCNITTCACLTLPLCKRATASQGGVFLPCVTAQADAYLYANPQKALGAVHFDTSNPQVCNLPAYCLEVSTTYHPEVPSASLSCVTFRSLVGFSSCCTMQWHSCQQAWLR